MAVSAAPPRRSWLGTLSPSELGLVGQVATSWGVAGGLLSAMVVAGHVLAGRLSSSMAFLTMTIFFVGGSLIGFLHGGLLGYLGRPAAVSRRLALRRLSLAGLYAGPAMLGGWAMALLVILSATALMIGRVTTLLVCSLGWIVAGTVLWWAMVETRRAFHHLRERWPDAGVLTVVLGLAFLALLPVFLVARPEIWVVGIRPTSTAASVMALGATLWIVGPLCVLALLARRAWTRHHHGGNPGRGIAHGG